MAHLSLVAGKLSSGRHEPVKSILNNINEKLRSFKGPPIEKALTCIKKKIKKKMAFCQGN